MNVELTKSEMTAIRDRAFFALRAASTELEILDALHAAAVSGREATAASACRLRRAEAGRLELAARLGPSGLRDPSTIGSEYE